MATISVVDTQVSGVDVQVYPRGGLGRTEVQVGDLLGGKGFAPHGGGDLAEVREVSAAGLWLVEVGALPAHRTSQADIRRVGKYMTWRGIAQLPLSRLRLSGTEVPTPSKWYITAKGELLVPQGYGSNATWALRNGRTAQTVMLPLGAELYTLGAFQAVR